MRKVFPLDWGSKRPIARSLCHLAPLRKQYARQRQRLTVVDHVPQ